MLKVSDQQSKVDIPYPRKRGPMGGASYIGPRLGDGPIFEVSVLHLDAKERPGKYPRYLHNSNSSSGYH